MINPLELPNCVLLDKSTLPAIPAIYFVVEESTILYVGSTLNLKQRWYTHHKYEVIIKDYLEARIHFYYIDNLDTLRSLETFFINELTPVLNSTKIFKSSNSISLRNSKVKDYPKAKIHFYYVDNLDTLRNLETFFINELSPVLNSNRVFKISKCRKLNYKKSKRLNVIISNFDRLQLKKWSKANGKTPSAYAAQLITEHIQTNLDLIDNLATKQAEALGMSKEDWINSIAGIPDE
ncbi:MAG TPA: GIY-YIG nuclease family protein [Phormidium sp.]